MLIYFKVCFISQHFCTSNIVLHNFFMPSFFFFRILFGAYFKTYLPTCLIGVYIYILFIIYIIMYIIYIVVHMNVCI